MLNAISVDIVMGANRLAQFVAYDHSGALSGWPAGKDHDATAGIRECRLKKTITSVNLKLATVLTKHTSKRPTATLIATPVHLNGRLSLATGHGSRASCSKMLVSWNST